MDQILIRGLKVYAYHGVNFEEKRDGQLFELDITAEVDLAAACKSDDLNDTVSYAKMMKTAIRVMGEAPYDLLERACERVAEQIFREYPPVEALEVLLKKPEAPIKAEFEYVAVCIRRRRSDFL